MSDRSVKVVALDMARLSRKAADVIAACCVPLGVASTEWSSVLGETPAGASVLVSGLRWGERAVPAELLAAAEGQSPRAPLLVLCAEALTAPSVELHQGLVTLTGTPLSPERLLGELRIALVRSMPEGVRLPVAAGVEVLAGFAWTACVGAEGARLPLLRETAQAFSVLVTFEKSPAWEADAIVEVCAALSDLEDPAALLSLLGDRAGFVRFDAAAQEWLVYWPSDDAPLYFHSPGRLPRCVDLRSSGPARLQRLAAMRGDALVGLSTRAPAGFPEPHLLSGGAPGFLHRAAPALSAAVTDWSCLCIEARA